MHFFWREFPWADPLAVCAHLLAGKQNPMLFFSGIHPPAPNGGRFSFLPFAPQQSFFHKSGEDFLGKLERELGAEKKITADAPEVFRHFCGGLAGFFSYEFAHELEKFTKNQHKKLAMPLAFFQKFETLFAFDHVKKKAFLAGWFENEAAAEDFFEKYPKTFISGKGANLDSRLQENLHLQFRPEISFEEYSEALREIKEELIAGNSYQVNFSQKWSAETNAENFSLFQILAQKNPAPMMFFLEHDDFSVISCTPERLFALQNKVMFAQPIKGTRPRGKNSKEDEALAQELLHDEKELAEHAMIVDLLRNDFGRVARFGSVEVRDFLRVEKYATVIHLVSDIFSELNSDKNVFDLIRAVFPGGSITGAPKISTMEIISRLEKSQRGAYCGSAGYISFNGNADFNILIRTIQKQGEKLEVRAGGGIVIDSTAEREYAESLEKVRGITDVLGEIM